MSAGAADGVVAPSSRPERGPRGRIWLYAIAFVLLLVAGYLQAKGNLRSQQGLVQTSIVLSVVATALAVASVLVPGRKVRPAASPTPLATTKGNGSTAGSTSPSTEEAGAEQPAAEPAPDADAQPEPEPEPIAEAEPNAESVPEQEPRGDPDPDPDPRPDPRP